MNPNDVRAILKGLNLASVAIPKLVDLVTHYFDINEAGELKETDKERMKANLDALKLKDWEDL